MSCKIELNSLFVAHTNTHNTTHTHTHTHLQKCVFRFSWRCDSFDIGRNVYIGRMTCLLLMNKDLFSLLGWNNIFDVNTNSDHVPQREINGRDIYFPQECPDPWPILRDIFSDSVSIPGGSRVLDTDGQTCCQVFLLVVRVFSPHSFAARALKVANIPAHKTFSLSASLLLPQTRSCPGNSCISCQNLI